MSAHQDDFADAHLRHWEDAEFLFEDERWGNADQLYGFSAECGLKEVLTSMGERIDPEYREHIRELWSKFQTFAKGLGMKPYLSMLPKDDPFSDWSTKGRYASSHCFDKENVSPHRDAAGKVRDMIEAMKVDGQP